MPEYKALAEGMFDSMAGVEAVDRMMLTTFPDFRATVGELLQDGDKVVARDTFSGTHTVRTGGDRC